MENWLNYSQWSLFSINLLWNINKFDFSRRRFPLPYPRIDCLNKCQGFLFQLIIDDNVLFKKLENTVSWSSQVLRGGEVGRCVEPPPPSLSFHIFLVTLFLIGNFHHRKLDTRARGCVLHIEVSTGLSYQRQSWISSSNTTCKRSIENHQPLPLHHSPD